MRVNLLQQLNGDSNFGSHAFAVFDRAFGLMEVSKVNVKSLQKVWEGPAGKGCGLFVIPGKVGMRTKTRNWNIPSTFGPHGELFLLIKKSLLLFGPKLIRPISAIYENF